MILAEAAAQQGSSLFTFLPLILIIVAVYFLMIRPQSKKRREAATMQSSLGPGDEIVTIGGLYGTVTDVNDETVTLEISPGVTARYARQAVGRVLTSTPVGDDAEEETPQVDNSAAEKTVDHG